MSRTILNAQARFTHRVSLTAEARDRREAIARARQAILPRLLVPANDEAPKPA